MTDGPRGHRLACGRHRRLSRGDRHADVSMKKASCPPGVTITIIRAGCGSR
jgi:hypothetical protein